MLPDEILPDRSTEEIRQKQNLLCINKIQIFDRQAVISLSPLSFIQKMQTTPNAAVIPTQVTVVNFSILTDTRNHVRNPVIVMETTFENIHPFIRKSRTAVL